MIGRKINCVYNINGLYCTNEKTKHSLFGLGERMCKVFDGSRKCELQKEHAKPLFPPPRPKSIQQNNKEVIIHATIIVT